MSDEQTDTGNPEEGDTSGVSGDASDANPESDDQGGESLEERLERVGKVVKETEGLDILQFIADREKAAADAAAANAGQNAQKTFDPKLDALKKELERTRGELKQIRRDSREAKINAAPESERAALKKLAELEDVEEDAQAKITFANEALRHAKAKELALDLREKGVKDVSKETFLDLDSPEAMDARAANLRAEHAEKALVEAIKGSGKNPPAASSKASRKGGGASGAGGASGGSKPTGEVPWAAQKGKGLTTKNLAAALKAKEEAEQ